MLLQEQWSMKPKLLVTLPSKQVVQYSENPLRKNFQEPDTTKEKISKTLVISKRRVINLLNKQTHEFGFRVLSIYCLARCQTRRGIWEVWNHLGNSLNWKEKVKYLVQDTCRNSRTRVAKRRAPNTNPVTMRRLPVVFSAET